jgi:hypothetical protein
MVYDRKFAESMKQESDDGLARNLRVERVEKIVHATDTGYDRSTGNYRTLPSPDSDGPAGDGSSAD